MHASKSEPHWRSALRRLGQNKVAVGCFGVILAYLLLALGCAMGLLFKDYNLVRNDLTYQHPSADFLLGTDLFGRSVLARAAHGSVTSITVGLFGSILSLSLGTLLGAMAGYFGGKVDEFIVWIYTTVDTVPYILLIVTFSFIMGPSLFTMCLAIGLTFWVGQCRIIRGEFIKHRDREYVQAADSLGASHARKIFLHIFPNTFHVLLTNFSLGFVTKVKSEVILSYLGLGVEPGVPSWGVMINDARLELARGVWWNLAAATGFMFVLVLAFNVFNDSLRDALNPRTVVK